jgi:hypothetical protein
MHSQAICPSQNVLAISRPENVVVIENHASSVLIRLAKDNFSSRQKSFFIRYLAAEGYIPEYYQRFVDHDEEFSSCLKWRIDNSLESRRAPAQRKALRDLLRVLFCVTLLWLALLGFVFLHGPW